MLEKNYLALMMVLALSVTGCSNDENEQEAKSPNTPNNVSDAPRKAPPIASERTHKGVYEYVLNNGLKLLVQPDHRAPVVVSQLWYHSGASKEVALGHKTGIAHMVEHLMFKATDKLKSGEFSQTVSNLGGSDNAFTSYDYTTYHQTLAAKHLPKVLEMEAERMVNLKFNQDEFLKERDVVREERRLRVDDSPYAKINEALDKKAFAKTPYAHPIVGWAKDIDSYTIKDAQRWYKSQYAPNNATLVIVGDVKPKEVAAWVNQYFGPIAPAPDIKPVRSAPSVGQPVRVEQYGRTHIPQLYFKWRVPSVISAQNDAKRQDAYALLVLSAVLDGSQSAILPKQLVKEQRLAHNAGADYSLMTRYDSAFVITAAPAPSISLDRLDRGIWEQIQTLKQTQIDPRVLERFKTQIIASQVYARDSMDSQASRLGKMDALGFDWMQADALIEQVKAVTPKDVQRVAQTYLTQSRLAVAVLKPEIDLKNALNSEREQTKKEGVR